MVNVTVYYEENNSICQEVLDQLEELSKEVEIKVTKLDIHSDFSLEEKFNGLVPLVLIGPYRLKMPLTKTDLLVAINATQDRHEKIKRRRC